MPRVECIVAFFQEFCKGTSKRERGHEIESVMVLAVGRYVF
jgi:hypothetical protein